MSWITDHIQTVDESLFIPRILHLVWVGPPIPTEVSKHIDQWKLLMPEWCIRVWRDEDINSENFPPDIVEKINLCEKNAQKADIMRYFIVEKHGGMYVDCDMKPNRSLEPLRFMRADFLICHDNTITWQFIINAFFAATPHHPIMKQACECARQTTINVGDIAQFTGPGLLGVAVQMTPPVDGRKALVLPHYYFYVNDNHVDRFAQHLYWHSWT